MWFHCEFSQTFKKEIIQILHRIFQKLEQKGALPNETKEKENLRNVFLMNIDLKTKITREDRCNYQ